MHESALITPRRQDAVDPSPSLERARPALRPAPRPAEPGTGGGEPAPGSPRRLGGGLARGRVRILLASDLLSVTLALVASYTLADLAAPPAISGQPLELVLLAVGMLVVWVAVLAAYGLYERQAAAISPAGYDELGQIFHALIAGSLITLVIDQVLRRTTGARVFSPAEAALFVAVGLPVMGLMRTLVRTRVLPAVMRPRRALIVGAGRVGRMIERKIAAHPEWQLELVGFVDDEPCDVPQLHVLGRTTEIARVVDELEIDWVLLSFSRTRNEDMLDQLREVRRPDVHLSIVPRYFELFASNARIEDLEGVPIVSLPGMSLSRSVHVIKRTMDVVGSGLGLLVLTPLLAVVAVAIKLDTRGPVLFRQERFGRDRRIFKIVKFRTMVDGAEAQRFALDELNEVDGPLFKIRDDPRVTRVGAFLRRTSLDELPQLWNVLRGEMSLVGPRPFVVHEAEKITGWAQRRVDITPGVTGLWQVSGRNDLSFEEMTKLDYVYVTNWSLWWDLKILLQTIPTVLARKGAY